MVVENKIQTDYLFELQKINKSCLIFILLTKEIEL